MISYVKGTLEHVSENGIVVETGGIGYQIFVSAQVMGALPALHSTIKIFTYMNVKDDGISLFGFNTQEELGLFNKLITVNGIGPKVALNLLGAMSASDIIMAIISDDTTTLSKAPGLGKKTAQRIILDLKDKFKNEDFLASIGAEIDTINSMSASDSKGEAMEALLSLGYSRSEAVKAVSAVYKEDSNTQTLVKAALKQIIKI